MPRWQAGSSLPAEFSSWPDCLTRPGGHEGVWNGTDLHGRRVSTGANAFRPRSGERVRSRQMFLPE